MNTVSKIQSELDEGLGQALQFAWKKYLQTDRLDFQYSYTSSNDSLGDSLIAASKRFPELLSVSIIPVIPNNLLLCRIKDHNKIEELLSTDPQAAPSYQKQLPSAASLTTQWDLTDDGLIYGSKLVISSPRIGKRSPNTNRRAFIEILWRNRFIHKNGIVSAGRGLNKEQLAKDAKLESANLETVLSDMRYFRRQLKQLGQVNTTLKTIPNENGLSTFELHLEEE